MGWQARAVVLLIFAAALCVAQDATIHTTVPLVVAPVSITDKAGKPIYGLTAEDFQLLDEGNRAKCKSRKRTTVLCRR